MKNVLDITHFYDDIQNFVKKSSFLEKRRAIKLYYRYLTLHLKYHRQHHKRITLNMGADRFCLNTF